MARDTQVRGTANNGSHSDDVQIVTWLLFVVALVVVEGHFVVKWIRARKARVRRVNWDDAALATALALALGQTIAVSVQANSALGRHISILSTHQVNTFQAAQYAATMLYILSIGTTRISMWLFVWQSVQEKRQKWIAIGMGALCLLWTLTGFIAAAASCDEPNPWTFLGNQCYDRLAFARYVASSNIVLELSSIAIPILLLKSRAKKCWTTLAFCSRFLLIVTFIPQIYYSNTLSTTASTSNDFTFQAWSLTTCTQLAQSLALLTTCLPSSLCHILPAKPGPIIRHLQWDQDHTHPAPFATPGFPPPLYPTRPALVRTKASSGYVAPLATYHFTGKRNDWDEELSLSSSNTSKSASPLRASHDEIYRRESDVENVFERRWNVPDIAVCAPRDPPPTRMQEIGVLPECEMWGSETDSEQGSGGERAELELQRCRARGSGVSYVFKRDKVISLPPVSTPSWEEGWQEGFSFG
ncbi:uncharacterized protein BDZ99DRAFT_504053 [Mytilinidion resinicola]|uniref:Rhodopsin domain-containing protein n=1 Tax=Mytilinidion resinicola TaxID=574789 RepID=A0A6A6Y184_9PEZI|nr:uncharacterized protein BDZ99DRAFT_504053 [Mytilinidion resinicola]KAF2802318.1 hypothetical protein BDZ99DRAFT_504053 [Mytilinidion resinicola]